MDPKSLYVCSRCGNSTWEVDVDYLVGYDHLACHLLDEKKLKLENWNKLEGYQFDVLGVTLHFKDAEYHSETNRYTIWVDDTALSKTEPLMRVDLYLDEMEVDIKTFVPSTFHSPPFHTNKRITKDHIKHPTIFVQTIGQMMMDDKMIRSILDFLAEAHKFSNSRGGMSGGILNTATNSANTITFGSASLNLW